MGHQTWSLTTAKVVNQDIVNKKWPKNTTESTEGTIQNGNAPIMAVTELIGKAFGLNLQFHGLPCNLHQVLVSLRPSSLFSRNSDNTS